MDICPKRLGKISSGKECIFSGPMKSDGAMVQCTKRNLHWPHKWTFAQTKIGETVLVCFTLPEKCIFSRPIKSGALKYSNLTSIIKGMLLKTSMVDMTVVLTAGYGGGTRSTVVCHSDHRSGGSRISPRWGRQLAPPKFYYVDPPLHRLSEFG